MEILTRIDTYAPAVLLPYSIQPSPSEGRPAPYSLPVAHATNIELSAEWLAADPILSPALGADLQRLSETDDGHPLLTSMIGFGELSALLESLPACGNKAKLQQAMSGWGGFSPDYVRVDFRAK